MWACVSHRALSVSPSRATSAFRRSRSPPGSIRAASRVWSHRTIEQFCWKPVTGTVRYCSMGRLWPQARSAAARRPRAVPLHEALQQGLRGGGVDQAVQQGGGVEALGAQVVVVLPDAGSKDGGGD